MIQFRNRFKSEIEKTKNEKLFLLLLRKNELQFKINRDNSLFYSILKFKLI